MANIYLSDIHFDCLFQGIYSCVVTVFVMRMHAVCSMKWNKNLSVNVDLSSTCMRGHVIQTASQASRETATDACLSVSALCRCLEIQLNIDPCKLACIIIISLAF